MLSLFNLYLRGFSIITFPASLKSLFSVRHNTDSLLLLSIMTIEMIPDNVSRGLGFICCWFLSE